VISHKDYASRDMFDQALVAAIRECGATLVCLAGFMRRLGAGLGTYLTMRRLGA